MNYLFLFLGAFFGVAKGFFGKKTSSGVNGLKYSVKLNTLRAGLSAFFGCILVLAVSGVKGLSLDFLGLIPCIFSGVCTAIFTVCWLVLVKRHAYLLVDVFLTIGLALPLLLSAIFFNERLVLKQGIGLVFILLSTLATSRYDGAIKEKNSKSKWILLITVSVCYGGISFCQKWFTSLSNASAITFNFYTYLICAIFLLMLSRFLRQENKEKGLVKGHYSKVVFIAVCTLLNSLFLTLAVKSLPSFVVYPIKQGTSTILSFFMAWLIFKERPKPNLIIGVVLSFVGIMLINA